MVMPCSPLARMLQLDEPCQTYCAISQDRVPLDGLNATAREFGPEKEGETAEILGFWEAVGEPQSETAPFSGAVRVDLPCLPFFQLAVVISFPRHVTRRFSIS
jgi:hypothetical protein